MLGHCIQREDPVSFQRGKKNKTDQIKDQKLETPQISPQLEDNVTA